MAGALAFAASGGWGFDTRPSASLTIALDLPERRSDAPEASDLFVVQGVDPATCGVPDLVSMMAATGVGFYRSDALDVGCDPGGIIGSDDMVLLKINCQWDQRGGTNTDLLSAVIDAIVDHPDGFTGEIVVADNGQRQYGSSGRGGSMDWVRSNAEDRGQSVQDVVDSYVPRYAVSTFLWDDITTIEVSEYDAGDDRDGYVIETAIDPRSDAYVCYPKFRSVHGTYVSFKNGVWDPSSGSYDERRLRVINLPVLKPHSIYGVTGCVKHYMGVTSDAITRRHGARAHDTILAGGMGTVMGGTRVPDLNILDAIWVSLEPRKGPWVDCDQATRLDIVAASTDPVALDAWASKYVLMAGTEAAGFSAGTMNPDASRPSAGSFARYLAASADILREDGVRVTADETLMNVFVRAL